MSVRLVWWRGVAAGALAYAVLGLAANALYAPLVSAAPGPLGALAFVAVATAMRMGVGAAAAWQAIRGGARRPVETLVTTAVAIVLAQAALVAIGLLLSPHTVAPSGAAVAVVATALQTVLWLLAACVGALLYTLWAERRGLIRDRV